MIKPNKIAFVLVLLTLAFVAWVFLSGSLGSLTASNQTTAPNIDPIDTAELLYNPWLDALQSTTTEPNYQALLAVAPVTDDLRSRLLEASGADGVDPVTCQATVPRRLGSKVVFVAADSAQLIIVARGSDVSEQALYSFTIEAGRWVVSDIACSQGEVAPEVEFTFANQGSLLRDSLQAPLDNQQWHLVYDKDGVVGYAIPLQFDETSLCVRGSEEVCELDRLREGDTALVLGDMREDGVVVERVEFR